MNWKANSENEMRDNLHFKLKLSSNKIELEAHVAASGVALSMDESMYSKNGHRQSTRLRVSDLGQVEEVHKRRVLSGWIKTQG